MNNSIFKILNIIILLVFITSYNLRNMSENEEKSSSLIQGSYDEVFRPQIHFTPAKNFMNDPNGLILIEGTYHLYFQFNPEANVWGNMSWGHATSKDLIHWEEQPVAIKPNELGVIFSGSCILDKENKAGFGENKIIAIYTSCDLQKQQQSIAYSNDGGQSFINYSGNPVIPNDDGNLRDPKVFWHEETKKWIMILAKGLLKGVEIYGSENLKEWKHLSTFVIDIPVPDIQWECPDLFQLDYKGSKKWVLISSVNPRGSFLGSGTMYFLGNFDGKTFTPDPLNYPIWFDYGMDNYAGVSYSNTGDRKILIGWMNNWSYAPDVPVSPWRSAMTLPRELKLVEYEGKPILVNTVVEEINKIAGPWVKVENQFEPGVAYQLKLKINLNKNSQILLKNNEGERFIFEINSETRKLTAYRNGSTGKTNFNGKFSVPSLEAPLNVSGDEVTFNIFVDQSSIEIFTENGSMSMTNLIFPTSIYNYLSVYGVSYKAEMRCLNSIWKTK